MSYPVYLTVVQTAGPGFVRWRIHDSAHRWWTGSGWSGSLQDALLYESNQSACFDCQKLLMAEYAGRRVRRFQAPVYVDVFCDESFSEDQLRVWLVKAAWLCIDHRGAGFGPLRSSLGLLRIEWADLTECPT